MNISIRQIEDIANLMEWRRRVVKAVFGCEPDELLEKESEKYYTNHAADGTHFAVIASADGEDAGCGAVCFQQELPSPENISGRCGYIMNVYVKENMREHGIGEKIVGRLIEECQRRNCGKIYLETTAEGRQLYENLGFSEMKDMMEL